MQYANTFSSTACALLFHANYSERPFLERLDIHFFMRELDSRIIATLRCASYMRFEADRDWTRKQQVVPEHTQRFTTGQQNWPATKLFFCHHIRHVVFMRPTRKPTHTYLFQPPLLFFFLSFVANAVLHRAETVYVNACVQQFKNNCQKRMTILDIFSTQAYCIHIYTIENSNVNRKNYTIRIYTYYNFYNIMNKYVALIHCSTHSSFKPHGRYSFSIEQTNHKFINIASCLLSKVYIHLLSWLEHFYFILFFSCFSNMFSFRLHWSHNSPSRGLMLVCSENLPDTSESCSLL